MRHVLPSLLTVLMIALLPGRARAQDPCASRFQRLDTGEILGVEVGGLQDRDGDGHNSVFLIRFGADSRTVRPRSAARDFWRNFHKARRAILDYLSGGLTSLLPSSNEGNCIDLAPGYRVAAITVDGDRIEWGYRRFNDYESYPGAGGSSQVDSFMVGPRSPYDGSVVLDRSEDGEPAEYFVNDRDLLGRDRVVLESLEIELCWTPLGRGKWEKMRWPGECHVADSVSGPRGNVPTDRRTIDLTERFDGGLRVEVPELDPDRGAHTVVIEGSGHLLTGGGTAYEIRVPGQLRQVDGTLDGKNVTITPNDNVPPPDEGYVEGQVRSGADGFEVTGGLPAITLDEPDNARVWVDGEPYHTVVIDGSGSAGETGYTVEASGPIGQVEGRLAGRDVTVNENDRVSGSTAEGHVAGAADGFAVTGGVSSVTLTDPAAATVYVDGREYHTVVIDGSGTTGDTEYTVRASGSLRKADGSLSGRSVTVNSRDSVRDGTATGRVAGAGDGYVVTGPLPSVTLTNPLAATVYIDGQEYHTVVIDGGEGSGESDYTIEVDGRLTKASGRLQGRSVTANEADEVGGGSAEGHVGGAADGYRVFGEIRSIQLVDDGAAAVLVDGVAWSRVLEQMPGPRTTPAMDPGPGDLQPTPEFEVPAGFDSLRAEAGGSDAVALVLEEKNGSGMRGMGAVGRQGGSITVELMVQGLDDGQRYPAHLHRGTCADGGGVAAPLSDVEAEGDLGTSSTDVPVAEISGQTSYFVQVHRPDGSPAACGDAPDRAFSPSGG